MRNIAKLTTSAVLGMGLVLGSGSALAAAPAKGTQSQAEVNDAMLYLKVLISGLQSEKVEQPVKGALVGCLYNNSLGKITESMDKVIAENPGKIHKDNPAELLGVMVRICGYNPQAAASDNAAKGR
ncbi:hypothetical protein GCM10011349_42260 [Novosphingobium indicum]|uniref:Rap1a immunity protein domain-containing protein n=1 Tax=Novosphingobium indicum TaxID=462949 RepID=A0ABQ2JZE9_9SPHN|nr:hypothetical protein [Novosphingobium indicum]GGN60566.1 hypothetical protein GCM10011349_42260 [Novosphingobium indicum]